MVQVRAQQPTWLYDSVNLELWLRQLNERNPELNLSRVREVCDLSQQAEAKAVASNAAPSVHSSFVMGLEMADILTELHIDEDGLVAAIIYRAVRENQITVKHVRKQFGEAVAELVEGVLRMAAISNIKFGRSDPVLGQNKDRLEQAKHLLVSLVDDVRVALIKIAERSCAIRNAANMEYDRQQRLAREVFDIYAPLAHRLGIGHLKWELEDIAFRYLEPESYKQIATLLDEKRATRDSYISQVIDALHLELKQVNITGSIAGRAKHIYSIWRKMRAKGISFSEVYDVRAVRILVPDINDCYTVLGIVHRLWRNIPQEFDDYIAAPKENGYRSLHTAVIGPEGKILEIQIRTHEMHEEAELGVCSHWRYKGSEQADEPVAYEQRIQWLRQLIEWQEEFSDVSSLTKELFSEVRLERIYVFTPNGDVLDLSPGATPVDFAYCIHTEVGHKCRGAKVNGRVVPLNTSLQTGDSVEVILSDEAEPRREWLHRHLGYITTSRARAKVKSWFGQRAKMKNIEDGRRLLLDEFSHLDIDQIDEKALLAVTGFEKMDDAFEAVGSGDVEALDIVEKVAEHVSLDTGDQQLNLVLSDAEIQSEQLVDGIGDLNYELADCCGPTPGAAIVGVIGDGNVVVIHQQDCLQALRADIYGHLVSIDWNAAQERTFPVSIAVEAYDRRGLLYDITGIFMNQNVNVTSLNSVTDKQNNRVDLKMVIEVGSINTLLKSLEKIEALSNVVSARRAAG